MPWPTIPAAVLEPIITKELLMVLAPTEDARKILRTALNDAYQQGYKNGRTDHIIEITA